MKSAIDSFAQPQLTRPGEVPLLTSGPDLFGETRYWPPVPHVNGKIESFQWPAPYAQPHPHRLAVDSEALGEFSAALEVGGCPNILRALGLTVLSQAHGAGRFYEITVPHPADYAARHADLTKAAGIQPALGFEPVSEEYYSDCAFVGGLTDPTQQVVLTSARLNTWQSAHDLIVHNPAWSIAGASVSLRDWMARASSAALDGGPDATSRLMQFLDTRFNVVGGWIGYAIGQELSGERAAGARGGVLANWLIDQLQLDDGDARAMAGEMTEACGALEIAAAAQLRTTRS